MSLSHHVQCEEMRRLSDQLSAAYRSMNLADVKSVMNRFDRSTPLAQLQLSIHLHQEICNQCARVRKAHAKRSVLERNAAMP